MPVFLCVGRVAVEKNLEAFLDLDLPGTKLIVGDGPARAALERKYPNAVFLGARHGEELAEIYAASDIFVFPSRPTRLAWCCWRHWRAVCRLPPFQSPVRAT